MSLQKTQDNYRNGSCLHKNSCRYILEGLLDRTPISSLASLTLPAKEFKLEEALHARFPTGHMHLVEMNPSVYIEQKSHSFMINKPVNEPYGNIHHYNNNVFNVLSWNPLNFVWLDLCGYLTEDTFYGLVEFLKNNALRYHGVFAITIMSSRQNEDTKKFFSRLQKEYLGSYLATLQNFRNIQLPKILQKVLEENTNRKFQLQANYSYKPSSGGGIMTMYAFTWSI